MKNLNLTLLRHLPSEANKHNEQNPDRVFGGQTDYGLTNIDRSKVPKLYDNYHKVLVSPLRRAIETSDLILEGRKKIEIIASLSERDLGRLSGLKSSEVEKELPELATSISTDPNLKGIRETFDNRLTKLVGAESYQEVIQRLRLYIGPLLENNKEEENYLIISHKHTIRCMIHWLLEKSKEDESETLKREIKNAVPIKLRRELGKWKMTES